MLCLVVVVECIYPDMLEEVLLCTYKVLAPKKLDKMMSC